VDKEEEEPPEPSPELPEEAEALLQEMAELEGVARGDPARRGSEAALVRLNHPSLLALDWARQDLEDQEVERLANALVRNSSLHLVDLSGNPRLTDAGVQALLTAIRPGGSRPGSAPASGVRRVRLDDNPQVSRALISQVHRCCLSTWCRVLRAGVGVLRTAASGIVPDLVDWRGMEATDSDAMELASILLDLDHESSIKAVDLGDNRLTAAGIYPLENALRASRSVQWCNAVGNQLRNPDMWFHRLDEACLDGFFTTLRFDYPTITEVD